MKIEIFPNIDVEIITDKPNNKASIWIINHHQNKTHFIGTKTINEAYTILYKLRETLQKMRKD